MSIETVVFDRTKEMNMMNVNGIGALPFPAYYPQEVFATSPVFPDYWVGNFGTVLTKDGYVVKQSPSRQYMRVTIFHMTKEGVFNTSSIPVHRAVMIAHNPVDNFWKLTVNHLNGVTIQNVYAPETPWHNLEWEPIRDNNLHAQRNGLNNFHGDESQRINLLPDDQLHHIFYMFSIGHSINDVIEDMGFPRYDRKIRDRLRLMMYGEIRPDIACQYNLPNSRDEYHTEQEVIAICEALQKLSNVGTTFRKRLIQGAVYEMCGCVASEKFITKIKNRWLYKWKYITDRYTF